MAVYEYMCPECLAKSEVTKPMKDFDREERCLKCGHVLKRLYSANGFILKGGGWYRDGYSKAKPPAKKHQSK